MMSSSAKLYYGNGKCSIEEFDHTADGCVIHIAYTGAIEIDDKTPNGFYISATDKIIGIANFAITSAPLGLLFLYKGNIKIRSVKIAKTGEYVPVTIHKVMDYSELLNTNAEDMTTKSEDLKATEYHGIGITKTVLKQKIIPNLNTSDGSVFYLPDDTRYQGAYHIHIDSVIIMTGAEHTEESIRLKSKAIRPIEKKRMIKNTIPNVKRSIKRNALTDIEPPLPSREKPPKEIKKPSKTPTRGGGSGGGY